MLTQKDLNEIAGMSNDELRWGFNIMAKQAKMPFLVGDRERPIAVRDAIEAEVIKRGGAIVRN